MTRLSLIRILITGITVFLLYGSGLSGQENRGHGSPYLQQNLPIGKDIQRQQRLARRNAIPSEPPNMAVQNSQGKTRIPTPAEQKVLKRFVRENHPELIRLLNWLEKNRTQQYDNAIRSLAQSHDRLLMIQKRDPERYESALEQWKLRSRIQFTAAQLSLKDSPRLRKQLETLVRKQFDLRAEQLKQEALRIGQRLERVQAQLERIDSNLDAAVEREMRIAIRNANRMKNKLNSVNKSNPNPKSETSDDGS